MHPIDWLIVIAYLVWMVSDGLRRSRDTGRVDGYFLAGRSLPWWVVGLSVMATQLSAITIVGTTGQGYATGLRFIQFYFGLPLAMILLTLTVVPFFHRAKVYTAYEYLERRFDRRVRSAASALFLLGRAFSLGVVLAAPSIVIAAIFGWSIPTTVLLIGVPTVVYTALGGVQAVAWTDVKQMFIIVAAMGGAVMVLVSGILGEATVGEAVQLAGMTGRLTALDFRLDARETYTIWSGLLGGLFLNLAYFGCDQSQVQRYLTARSINEARHSLLMSAYLKIPLQLMILGTGVLVFVFYVFHAPPLLFNAAHDARVAAGLHAAEYAAISREFEMLVETRRDAAGRGDDLTFLDQDARVRELRGRAVEIVRETTGDEQFTDVNYVFPTFITTRMPIGLIGLMIAAIFAAAMSTAAGELSALSSATIMDFYRQYVKKDATDGHYVAASKTASLFWGLFACVVAIYASGQGSLIEVVNRYGSFFYGSLLGVFMLAMLTKRATSMGALVGLAAGMTVVLIVAFTTPIAFLWHNLIGAVVVFVTGMTVSVIAGSERTRPAA